MEIDPKDLEKKLQSNITEAKFFLKNTLPVIIGREAVSHFKKGFQKGVEGFTDKGLVKWQEVKRRINPRRPDRAAAERPILTGETGDLGRSIEYEIAGDKAIIYSDVSYARYHNEGTEKMPKRQFIGESEALDKKIMRKTNKKIEDILK